MWETKYFDQIKHSFLTSSLVATSKAVFNYYAPVEARVLSTDRL